MRILSQDGLHDGIIDVPYEQVSIEQKENEIWCGYSSTMDRHCVGKCFAKYSAEAKARKAMEMLHEAYTGIPLILQNVDISDDVTKMFEKWKKQGICVVSENQPSKVEYVGNVLFQFPTDDEVEV